MSWLASILVGIFTGVASLFAAGFIASLAVDWYHITSREGAAGYFVVGIALLGFFGGLILGLVIARVVAGSSHPQFLRALGYSLGVLLAVGGTSIVITRLLADIPPEIDGQALFLKVELRWPAGQAPTDRAGEGYLRLHSVPMGSHVVRASSTGRLWLEDSRQVDGRWVTPGAVEVFTRRGSRSIVLSVDTTTLAGFLIPLPANPGKKFLEWSHWLPEPPAGKPPWPADQFSFRYRVAPKSEALRTETIGPFEVVTYAAQMYESAEDGKSRVELIGSFEVRHGGKQIGERSIGSVSVVGGSAPAFVAAESDPSGSDRCVLIHLEGTEPRRDPIAHCSSSSDALPLTNDSSRFRTIGKRRPLRGRIDRVTYAEPGLYLVNNAVFDSRALTVRDLPNDPELIRVPSVAPLGVSPDERSVATYGLANHSDDSPTIAVGDLAAKTHYLVPIDPKRMRFQTLESLDPAWLQHHFVWKRDSDGVDRLIERPGFTPIPYHGRMSPDGEGFESYRLEPAGEPLRAVVIDFLVHEFRGEAVPAESSAYEKIVKVDGREVKVAASGDFGYVLVSVNHAGGLTDLVQKIAARFDLVLATGKYDSLFGKERR